MNLFSKIILVIFSLLIFMCITVSCTIYTSYNSLVTQEEVISAQYKQNQNNYDNMWKKFKEAAQVNTMYTNDLKKVFDSAISARYGKEGSQAVFQFLKEHNPTFDSSMYTKLQAMIESGRNSFEVNQKMLIDKKQVYQAEIRRFPTNLIAGVFGFPKIDLAKMDIVTSEDTDKAFETKKTGELKLR